MNTIRKEQLKAAAIDVDGVLERLMGNESLLERLLGKFPEDANYEKLTAAIDKGDPVGALNASHALKGICGNLGITALYDLLSKQVAALRANDWMAAVRMMEEISAAYEYTCRTIRENCDLSKEV